MANARQLHLLGTPIRVARAEDPIVYKAAAWRDRSDIERLLALHLNDIDLGRVHALVGQIGAALDDPIASTPSSESSRRCGADERTFPAGALESTPSMIGTVVANRYELVREIGRGGMGIVYLAHDPMLDREVAVKIVPPANIGVQTLDRFRREARTLAKMDHPSIVVVYDTGQHEDSLFLVMPLVRGVSLRQFLQDGPARLREILDVGIAVAEALDYSHAIGIVHRDVKPENILVARDVAGGIRVRITDFGLAIQTAGDRLTHSDSLVGTIAYLSPEQVSKGIVDGRSDLYSLATVLYECFAGETPFGGGLANSLYRIVHERPLSFREKGVDLDPELEALILQCLEKDPSRRPLSCRHVAETLARCAARLPDRISNSGSAMSRDETQTARLDPLAISELIGRKDVMAEIERRLEAAGAGECQFIVIGGEAGTGKTRLLEAAHRLARLRPMRALNGRFVEHERGFPFQAFCELIIDTYRGRGSSESGPVPDLSDLLPDLLALFPALAEIDQIRSVSSVHLSDFERRRRMEDRTQIFELLARTLTRLGGGKPLLLLLEDMHAAEVSVDALQYIVRRLGPTPTMVIATYRSTSVDKRHPVAKMIAAFEGDRRFAAMQLQPLSRDEHRQFVESAINGIASDALAARLYEAAEGNPYFTKELIRSLLESNAIRRDGDVWSMAADDDESAEWLPATIQQAVERRIDGLAEEQRRLLSVASIVGKTFDSRDLRGLLEEGDEIDDVIDDLIGAGLIQEERGTRGERFTFSSGIVRDVLYNALPRRRRRLLHQKFAVALEEKNVGRLQRVYPQLLHHYAHGDVQEKVIDYGLRLAQKSLDTFAPEEVISACRLVLEFLEEDNAAHVPLRGEARMLLARAYRMTGNIDAALREVSESVRIFERESEGPRLLGALMLAAETAWEGRRMEQTRRWVDSACRLARASGAEPVLLRLLPLGASVANLRGDHDAANQYLAEAQALHRAARSRSEAASRGGTLRVALVADVQVRDPMSVALAEEEEVLANVFETLVARGAKGNLVPSICDKWDVRENIVTLGVRGGVELHDGRLLDAALVKEALDRCIAHPAGASTPALAAIAENGVRVVSADQLEIVLREPLPRFPAMLTHERTAIALPSADGSLVGTGPFRIAAFATGDVVLERNERYRGTTARLDRVEFKSVGTAADVAARFRAGAVDIARDLIPDDLDRILRDRNLRATVVESPKSDVYFVIMNRRGRVAELPAVRAALCRSFRPDDLVWGTLGRFAEPADGFIPPTILTRTPIRRRPLISREAAMEAIAASGLPLPLRLRAAVHPVLQDRYGSLTRTLFDAWKAIGVEVEIVTTDMNSYLAHLSDNAEIDILIGRFVADYEDPDNFIFGLLHSASGIFRHYFAAPIVDRLAEEARSEADSAAADRLYRRIETLLADSDFLLPLFHDIDYRVASPRIRDLELRSSPPYVNYAEVAKVEAPSDVRRSTSSATIPIVGEVRTLDPSETFLLAQAEVMPTIFETLTRQSESAQIVPYLASDFVPEDGGRRFRFRLRDGIRFHDGRRLTPRDVRYSFERALRNDQSKRRALLASIRGAPAIMNGESSELTGFSIQSALDFTIDLEQPVAFFPALLTYESAAIVPDGETDFYRRAIGTGPFRVVRFDPGRRLDLEANPYYWRRGLPRLDHLVFIFGVTPADVAEGFRDGRYSMAWNLAPNDVEVLRADPRLSAKYLETPLLSTAYLAFNAHRGPLADDSLRRAVVAAIDSESLVRRHVGRLGIPAHGMVPPGLLGYESRPRERPRVSAPTRSAELGLILNSVYEVTYAAFADGLRDALGRRRITLNNMASNKAEYFEALQNGTCDVILTRWVADYPDADTFIHDVLHSANGVVGKLCGSEEIDRLIERGRSEPHPARRHGVYREVEAILHERSLVLPLFHEQAYRFMSPDIDNAQLHFGFPALRYEELSIVKQS